MDDNNKSEDILIQVTCKFSLDNQRNGYYDLMTEKPENFSNQLLYKEDESNDKIFNETVEELNLHRAYLNGYDVTIVKYGKKNVFYEEAPTEKTDESTSSSEDSDDSENDSEFQGGLVQKFIRTVFEELVSSKNLNFMFSIGWTEINDQNQLLDLLNGNGLVQCFSLPQLMEMLSVGLSNRNSSSNHNILSIVLEQQWTNEATGQPQVKLSTVNFCDLIYGTDKTANNFISEPRDLPMNFYSQPVPPYAFMMPPMNGNYFSPPPPPPDFGFFNTNPMRANFQPMMAQQQSSKLLKNAEILFSKLNLNEMNDAQRKEIQEWMYLKTECDNFIPSPEPGPELPPSYFGNINAGMIPPSIQPPAACQQPSCLLPIIEMDETNDLDEEETNDNDSDCGYIDINDHTNNLFTKISDKMSSFRDKTDNLVNQKGSDYFQNNPKMLGSGPTAAKSVECLDEAAGGVDLKLSTNSAMNEEEYLAKSGRRRSIRDSKTLNSDELNQIRKAAAVATSLDQDSVKELEENELLIKLSELRKTFRGSSKSITTIEKQIKELDENIVLKKNLIADLKNNSHTKESANSKCNEKRERCQKDFEKASLKMIRAKQAGKGSREIRKLEEKIEKLSRKLKDLTDITKIAKESEGKKQIEDQQKSLNVSKVHMAALKKKLDDELKVNISIEKEIMKLTKAIETENESSNKKFVTGSPSPSGKKASEGKVKIRDYTARITHLNTVIKEKHSKEDEEKDKTIKDALRCEIRNLRQTRHTLQEEQSSLAQKLKIEKNLSHDEERDLHVCDEAIMAIDEVIELKNESICGHRSIDISEKIDRKESEQLLIKRLGQMTMEETRVMLYKYFMKVVDFKQSCKKLEHNLMALERQKEGWMWRENYLRNEIRQLELESERKVTTLQRKHEARMNLLWRQFANETTNSSVTESNLDGGSISGAAALPNYEELNIVKASKSRHQQFQQSQIHSKAAIDRDFRKNMITKFAAYAYVGGSSAPMAIGGKEAITIPQENLKQLKDNKPVTKVTRIKNKMVIQTSSKK